MTVLAPLLAWPTLSASARSLRGTEELRVQYILAGDTYTLLEDYRPTTVAEAMWDGCRGALLYWWGELARQMPQGAMDCPDYVRAWCRAYRAGEMAVGPLPWWLGDTRFHLACQSQLLAADPARYGGIFVHAPIDVAYIWPLETEGEWQWSTQ